MGYLSSEYFLGGKTMKYTYGRIKLALASAALVVSPTLASASANLKTDDFVGISFWFISMAMIATTVFLLMESARVKGKWKTTLNVSALVTLIAGVHYFYMREVWVAGEGTPVVYRYIDWVITVPLQMVEFYLILAAITAVSGGIFWRLLIGSVVMLVAGYMGEANMIPAMLGFVIGMAGWAYILYEIFLGEASQVAAEQGSPGVQSAYSTMRWIVSIGWAIYPIGYFMGYFSGMDAGAAEENLNLIYNLADVVNKIAFCLVIWHIAVTESEKEA
jgi:bacteriorhodopsin